MIHHIATLSYIFIVTLLGKVGSFLRRPIVLTSLIPWISVSNRNLTLRSSFQNIRLYESVIARELIAGRYVFSGKAVEVGDDNPFMIESTSLAWYEELMSFHWLCHLAESRQKEEQACLEKLIYHWVSTDRRMLSEGNRLPIHAERVVSLIIYAKALRELLSPDLYQRTLIRVYREVYELHLRSHKVSGINRLIALLSLSIASVATEELGWIGRYINPTLEQNLQNLVLASGGPIDRNPNSLLSITLLLVLLNQAYESAGQQPPPVVTKALSLGYELVARLRMPDGKLATFNGMGATDFDVIPFLSDRRFLQCPNYDVDTVFGYSRISKGQLTLIMDTGRPPPFIHSYQAHASTLAIEAVSGAKRFLVSCGAPGIGASVWGTYIRHSAAHSTAVVNNRSSARFSKQPGFFGRFSGILYGPKSIICERHDTDEGVMLRASQDGYERIYGLVLERRLQINNRSNEIKGQDFFHQTRVNKLNNVPFDIRFHISSEFSVSQSSESGAVFIDLGGGEIWEFLCENASVTIEPSAHVGSLKAMLNTSQIVLHGYTAQNSRVLWNFIRHNIPQ